MIAENITTRFLNIISLLTGSIPIVGIQLDALSFDRHLFLHFTQVIDQSELRIDDTEEETGGEQVDRAYWEKKAGTALMKTCDELVQIVNAISSDQQEFNYVRGYMGLRSNGEVNNFMTFSPKPAKNSVNVWVRSSNTAQWKDRLDRIGVRVSLRPKGRMRFSVTPDEFAMHKSLVEEIISDAIGRFEA